MNYLENQMLNLNYINESFYKQGNHKLFLSDQDERVIKTINSFRDILDQVKDMDMDHQQQAFFLCLTEIARRNEWK